MRSATSFVDINAPVPDEVARDIRKSDNNALIVRLHFAVHHLSRWLTPIHDPNRLERSVYRGEPTAKEIVVGMRDEEERLFAPMYLIAHPNQPKSRPDRRTRRATPCVEARDRDRPAILVMAQFRRLRQGTCSLLRSLPDDAWDLKGSSRKGQNVSIRQLAEQLAFSDYRHLRALDETLDQVGAREGLAEIQRAHLDELLKLVPTHLEV